MTRPVLTLTLSALGLLLGSLLAAEEGPAQRLERVRHQEAAWRALRDRPHSEARIQRLLATDAPLSLRALSDGPELPVPFSLELEQEAAYEMAWLDSLREEARVKRRVQRLRRAAGRLASSAPVPSAAKSLPKVQAKPAPASVPLSAPASAPVSSATKIPPAPKSTPKALALRPLSDPLDLGDAYYDAGTFQEALAQYGVAATADGISGPRLARARFGLARTLERLGRVEGALSAYESVSALPGAEPWTSAAEFGHRFLSWKHRLNKATGPQASAQEVQ